MEPTTIFLSACVIVLIYLVYYTYTFNATLLLSSITPANTITEITPPVPANGTILQSFTFSIWVNINDWNVNLGFYKNIISYGTSVYISLAPTSNDVVVALNTGTSGAPAYTVNAVIKNIPLQTWVHLAFSLQGGTMDTYMNGRIVSTKQVAATYVSPSSTDKIRLGGSNATVAACVVNVPSGSSAGPDLLSISWLSGRATGCSFALASGTYNPGFSGWITQFQYAQTGSDPQGIWNIYQQGNGTSMFSNFFGNYGLSLALTNNGVAQNSISI